jgi:peptidylprolyl isomerase
MAKSILIIAACTGLIFAGCGGDNDSSIGSTRTAPAKSSGDASNRGKPEVTAPEGAPQQQLEETDLIEGTGEEAEAGDEVTVQYVGIGYESDEEFDSSWSHNAPFSFTLGRGEVIPAWDQGIAGMKVGGQRELIVPPDLAYGAAGAPPAVEPNEALVFVVDLLGVK